MLRQGELQVLPLSIQVVSAAGNAREGVLLDVEWCGQSCRFVVELKPDAKPQTLKLAISQAKDAAERLGQGRPMIIAPYLSPEKLDLLLAQGVSGLDFCGNGAVDAPGQFHFYRAGNPNRYPDSAPIRSACRGDSSLVARALLLQPEFKAVGDILAAIRDRGGSLALSTVSKVLKRLESDLIVERPTRRTVRLIQPEHLLDQLLDAYEPPESEAIWLGKIAMPDAELQCRLAEIGRDGNLVLTGGASAGAYAPYAREPIMALYCRATPPDMLKRLGAEAKETRGFANLRLIQTDDQRVYFDRRAMLVASPIQAWLEMASGDKRQRESAAQIRDLLLRELKAKA